MWSKVRVAVHTEGTLPVICLVCRSYQTDHREHSYLWYELRTFVFAVYDVTPQPVNNASCFCTTPLVMRIPLSLLIFPSEYLALNQMVANINFSLCKTIVGSSYNTIPFYCKRSTLSGNHHKEVPCKWLASMQVLAS